MKKIVGSACLALLICVLFVGNAIADFNAIKNPYYTINFSAAKLGVEIRLNDAGVVTLDNADNKRSEVPVNEYIINGANEIKVVTFPSFDKNRLQEIDYTANSAITVGLYVREKGASETKRILISEVFIKPKKAYTRKPAAQAVKMNKESPDYKQSGIKVEVDAKLLSFPIYWIYKKQVVTSWMTTALKAPFLHLE